jgi:hypothetical protein
MIGNVVVIVIYVYSVFNHLETSRVVEFLILRSDRNMRFRAEKIGDDELSSIM